MLWSKSVHEQRKSARGRVHTWLHRQFLQLGSAGCSVAPALLSSALKGSSPRSQAAPTHPPAHRGLEKVCIQHHRLPPQEPALWPLLKGNRRRSSAEEKGKGFHMGNVSTFCPQEVEDEAQFQALLPDLTFWVLQLFCSSLPWHQPLFTTEEICNSN